ncbi:MAG: hypothetical protein Q8S84_01815 [bacterium]|nr:hypothetical protein [bacterium]MDP3380296.1 hypothetical protein [bacterium]
MLINLSVVLNSGHLIAETTTACLVPFLKSATILFGLFSSSAAFSPHHFFTLNTSFI